MTGKEIRRSPYDTSKRIRGRRWMEMRSILLMQQPLCLECKKVGRVSMATEVDHIVPLFKGGTDDLENLQGLCSEHHRIKTNSDLGYRPAKAFGVDGVPEGWI